MGLEHITHPAIMAGVAQATCFGIGYLKDKLDLNTSYHAWNALMGLSMVGVNYYYDQPIEMVAYSAVVPYLSSLFGRVVYNNPFDNRMAPQRST